MQKPNKCTITIILAVVLALSLLLTACSSKVSDTPAGDNSTPPGILDTTTTGTTPDSFSTSGTSSTPPITSSTPTGTPDTSTPAAMPGESNTPDTSTPAPLVKPPRPAEFDFLTPEYIAEAKAGIERSLAVLEASPDIQIDDFGALIERIYQEYGKYLNENITADALKIGIVFAHSGGRENMIGLTSDAIKKVNDFLTSNGEAALDIKDHEKNITALWLAASLYYDPNIETAWPPFEHYGNVAMAFALAQVDPSDQAAIKSYSEIFMSQYVIYD